MKKRFEVLDIFRGIFASMVMFFHLSPFSETIIINNNFINNSDLFVDFFFVLSGFVIAFSYKEIKNGGSLTNFYKKRFLRVYPLHIVMLFAFLFIELAKQFASNYVQVNQLNNPHNNIASFISAVFLMNSVPIPGVNDVSWNIPSWSISAEMISYLVFGVVMLAITRFNMSKFRNAIFLFAVAAAGYSLYWLTGGCRLTYSFNYGFLRGIMGFFTGVLCLNAYKSYYQKIDAMQKYFFHIAEAAIILLIILLVYQGEALKDYGYLFEGLFFCAILVFAFEKGFISKILRSSNFLHKAGKYSYSIYLTHALIVSLFNVFFIRILKLPPSAYSYLFIINYVIVFKFSEFTYKYVEMRFVGKKKSEDRLNKVQLLEGKKETLTAEVEAS